MAAFSCVAAPDARLSLPAAAAKESRSVLTVGSGDAAAAGYASAWVEQRPPVDRVRWAVAAGSASAATFGAGFSSSRPEVEALVSQVRIEDVAGPGGKETEADANGGGEGGSPE